MPLVAPFRRVAVACALALAVPAAAAAGVEIRETGSTLLYPVLNVWAAAFARTGAGVSVTTEATGSGAGISAAENGDAALGTSDAYLDDAHLAQGLLNVPLAVSAQFVAYHVTGAPLEGLRLGAELLADIYGGRLTTWDDPRLLAANPELRGKLPHRTIVPLVRSDRSGDTFLFTAYLRSQAPASWTLGPATAVAWPAVPGEQAAKGNAGLLHLLGAIDGSISFVGITYLEQARREGIGAANLRNRAGRYAPPSSEAILSAVAHAAGVPHDGRISLIDLAGNDTYPIVNIGYAIVKRQQTNAEVATGLKRFLDWVVDPAGGNTAALLGPVHFAPLPERVRAVAKTLIEAIK